jgi:hypothetical protein
VVSITELFPRPTQIRCKHSNMLRASRLTVILDTLALRTRPINHRRINHDFLSFPCSASNTVLLFQETIQTIHYHHRGKHRPPVPASVDVRYARATCFKLTRYRCTSCKCNQFPQPQRSVNEGEPMKPSRSVVPRSPSIDYSWATLYHNITIRCS